MAAVDATVALAAGTVLALGAALLVLGPLWNGTTDPEPSGDARRSAAGRGEFGDRAEGVSAVEALREIEFDRATGKLSDDDYAALKATYTRDALLELRAAQDRRPVAPAAVADPVEEALRAYRARRSVAPAGARTCVVDGPRPEADAVFCSACGRFLTGSCPHCGAACDREGQRFCSSCGLSLAPGASAVSTAVSAATQPT